MKIGIDARLYGPKNRGLGRYVQKLVEYLEKIEEGKIEGNEYIIFLRKENFNEYQPKNPRFKKVLADYKWYTLAEQLFMPRILYKYKLDLAHFPHFNLPIFYAGKFVVTIHDLIMYYFPSERVTSRWKFIYLIKYFLMRFVTLKAVRKAQKIIVPSKFTKQDLVKTLKVKPEKVVVTYEAIDQNYELRITNYGLLKNKYKITKPYLLYVGAAYPHKNLENLLKAFKILLEKYKYDLQLVLVGKMDYFYQKLKEKLWNLGSYVQSQVVLTDFVSDKELTEFYQKAALYVFPSFYEGFGLPGLEAASFGLPIVSSNSSSLKEILGEGALYFDPSNPKEMAEKINQALKDKNLQENLRKKGLENIKKYSWQKLAWETFKIYQTCI